jgi:hypothetical protein
VAFRAVTKGASAGGHLYRCDPATCPAALPAIAVQKDDLDAALNKLGGFSSPAINDAGDIAFEATARGGVCGVYIRRMTGGIETVALRGDPIPDVPGTAFFRCARPVAMSSGGRVVFKATYKEGKKSETGIFLAEP